MRRVISYLVIC